MIESNSFLSSLSNYLPRERKWFLSLTMYSDSRKYVCVRGLFFPARGRIFLPDVTSFHLDEDRRESEEVGDTPNCIMDPANRENFPVSLTPF